MKKYYLDDDSYIKEKFNNLARAVPEPDLEKAWVNLNRRAHRKAGLKYKVVAAVIVVIILMGITVPGPAQAFQNFFRVTLSRFIGDTLKFYQTGALNNEEVQQYEPETIIHNSISSLEKESGIFVPDNQFENVFSYAEILKHNNKILRVFMEFDFNGEKVNFEQIPHHGYGGGGRVIDIEDYETKTLQINNLSILVCSHKSGSTSFQWEDDEFDNSFYGNCSLDDLLKYANLLEVF